MVCPHCHAALSEGVAFCSSCGAAVHPAAADAAPAATTPITPASAAATARQVGAQLDDARRSLPYGSVHLAAGGFAIAAVVLSLTSWGARPSWLLTILTLAGMAVVTAADLRRRGAFEVSGWPLTPAHETLLAAATAILLASTTLISLHTTLGSLMWLLALAAFVWGAWPLLHAHVDVRPARLLSGYRTLAIAGVVVLLAAMTQNFGQASNNLFPGYGYGCGFSGCGYGVNYGMGSMMVFGVVYPGIAVEWAEIIVVALFAGLAALLAVGDWRPQWWRFVPVATAALTIAWLAWALYGSALVNGGSKQLAWWIAIAALAAYTAGSAFIALGQDDGAYAPARLVSRLRGEQPAS